MTGRRSPILGVILLVLAGCTGPSGGPGTASAPITTASKSSAVTSSAVTSSAVTSSAVTSSPDDPAARATQAVQQMIDTFDRTAGGPVSAQQDVLATLISAGQQSVQRRCAAATSTIGFEPVYDRLAPAPGWKPAGGTLPGTVYALPTLIRVYTGDRITGTDLTDLHLTIDDGVARLPALCLN